MDTAISRRAGVAAAAALSFCSLLGLMAREKEKPLLRVHEEIASGFAGGTQKRFLEVSQSGGISLKKTFVALLLGKKTRDDGTKAMLSPSELQALRNFLNSSTVLDLHDSYVDREFTSDYSASMEIEMTPDEKTKRIVLSHLDFAGTRNSKVYPVPIHDLVCKIYGLEERVGIPYGRAVRVEPDGHESDDTWCGSASLKLIPKAAP